MVGDNCHNFWANKDLKQGSYRQGRFWKFNNLTFCWCNGLDLVALDRGRIWISALRYNEKFRRFFPVVHSIERKLPLSSDEFSGKFQHSAFKFTVYIEQRCLFSAAQSSENFNLRTETFINTTNITEFKSLLEHKWDFYNRIQDSMGKIVSPKCILSSGWVLISLEKRQLVKTTFKRAIQISLNFPLQVVPPKSSLR